MFHQQYFGQSIGCNTTQTEHTKNNAEIWLFYCFMVVSWHLGPSSTICLFFLQETKNFRINARQCWNKWNTNYLRFGFWPKNILQKSGTSLTHWFPSRKWILFFHMTDFASLRSPLFQDLRRKFGHKYPHSTNSAQLFPHAVWRHPLWHRKVTWSEIWPLKVLVFVACFFSTTVLNAPRQIWCDDSAWKMCVCNDFNLLLPSSGIPTTQNHWGGSYR